MMRMILPEMKGNKDAQQKMGFYSDRRIGFWMDHHELQDNAHDIGIIVAKRNDMNCYK